MFGRRVNQKARVPLLQEFNFDVNLMEDYRGKIANRTNEQRMSSRSTEEVMEKRVTEMEEMDMDQDRACKNCSIQ